MCIGKKHRKTVVITLNFFITSYYDSLQKEIIS